MGWSYGGYAVMDGLAFSPDTYVCGMAMYGISDLTQFLKTDYAGTPYWKTRVGDVDTEAAMLRRSSPINYSTDIKAPLLLTTGSKDKRVTKSQADTMAMALRDLGKKVVYFYYPDEGHDYQKNESWLSFWAVAEKFLSVYLGGSYQPEGDDIVRSSMVMAVSNIEGLSLN